MGPPATPAWATSVRERCEPEFLPKLSKAQKRAYDREQRRCDQKYAAAERHACTARSRPSVGRKARCAHAAKFGATVKAKR